MAVLNLTTAVVYATLSAAIAGSNPGDRIGLPPGRYIENFPPITHSLTIEGMGGMAHLSTPGAPLNNRAILYVVRNAGADLSVRNLELSGAASSNDNAAGILFELGNHHLSITASWFHNNQEGVLVGESPVGTVTITHSEFDHNGLPPSNSFAGLTHNLYVGRVARLTVTHSYFHDALGGHEIKSRARVTVIRRNRIQDGPTADTSYSIDIPDGGHATIVDNVIEQGPRTANRHAIHFGGERVPSYPGSNLQVRDNVLINDLPAGGVAIYNDSTNPGYESYGATVVGNIVYGFPRLYRDRFNASQGPRDRIGPNQVMRGPAPALDTSHPWGHPWGHPSGRLRAQAAPGR